MTRLILMFCAATLFCTAYCAVSAAEEPPMDENENAVSLKPVTDFLDEYQAAIEPMSKEAALASWKAATTGKEEDFDDSAEKSLAIRKYLSNPEMYQRVKSLNKQFDGKLDKIKARELEQAERSFRANQLPQELLKQMVEQSTEIERIFNTFRGEVDGKKYSNNELLEMLADFDSAGGDLGTSEEVSAQREQIWAALKQVGAAVGPKLIELAKVRNQAARQLGFDNYWEMRIYFQEHDPEYLMRIFGELEELTNEPFKKMKGEMDAELGERFKMKSEALMPWHYDNPFFQAPPPSAEVDLNIFYEDKSKEDICEISRQYFGDLGLPVESILANSDLYEREGKDQHAFCTSIDNGDDVRILCNIKPTADWMTTQLHELGHAVYSYNHDRKLPYMLRDAAHALTTEGVAMYFGALASSPPWMIEYADAKPEEVAKMADAIREQRRREQLIFARWVLVMLNFEKAFYENPDQDLNTLWWDMVERYQMLKRPADRNAPDWAAKPHFTIAPVYYHNYMLGELFAAQLRNSLKQKFGEEAANSGFVPGNGNSEKIGAFMTEKVFAPGSLYPWPEFVQKATGSPLTSRFFVEEIKD